MPPVVKNLKITITAKSPVRVGGPRDPVRGVDLPMATISGMPVIPGASLKGALRAQLEEYLLELGKANSAFKPCIPSAKPSKFEEKLAGYREGGACSAPLEEENEDNKRGVNTICPACYLLGAQGLMGFVRVPFLYSSNSQEELVEIAIDRGRPGSTRTGSNRDYEFVPTNGSFVGTMEILLQDPAKGWSLGKSRPQFETLDAWLNDKSWTQERIIKELIVDRLMAIKKLGGFKSKGCGDVSIAVTST